MLLLFNKPYNVLSQFSKRNLAHNTLTLADFINQPGYYPAGRLDKDSEGLLLLTNNGKLQHKISHPEHKEKKTYLAQLEGEIDEPAMVSLCQGVHLKDGLTRPAQVEKISPPDIWPRTPPIRFRQSIPTCWIEISISEGKNRQIRRMTAHVGFPTLRLIRLQIGKWTLENLQPGQFHLLDRP